MENKGPIFSPQMIVIACILIVGFAILTW